MPLKPSLNHSIPKGWERNEDLALAIVIFGDTNEAVGSERKSRRVSESDGISPTIAGEMTCVIIYKSEFAGLLNGTRSGLLQLKHRKREDSVASQAAHTGSPWLSHTGPQLS